MNNSGSIVLSVIVFIGLSLFFIVICASIKSQDKREQEEKIKSLLAEENKKSLLRTRFETNLYTEIDQMLSDNNLLFDVFVCALSKRTIYYTFRSFDVEKIHLVEYNGNEHNLRYLIDLNPGLRTEIVSELIIKLTKRYKSVTGWERNALLKNISSAIIIETQTQDQIRNYVINTLISKEIEDKIVGMFNLYTERAESEFYEYIADHPEAFQIAKQNELLREQVDAIKAHNYSMKNAEVVDAIRGVDRSISDAILLGTMLHLH